MGPGLGVEESTQSTMLWETGPSDENEESVFGLSVKSLKCR